MRIQYAGCTHIGKVKKRNEDSMHWPKEARARDIVIVADGMGGYHAGDVASSMAVQISLNIILAHKRGTDDAGLIRQAITAANRSILDYASQNEFFSGMGTTMVVALRRGKKWTIGHVGDSRAYMANGDKIHQITHDHSLVQAMMDDGKLTYEEARKHPYRNIIMRAVGTEPDVEIDIYETDFAKGDVLLVCSDGLIRQVQDEELLTLLQNQNNMDSAAQAMVNLANDRGGPDNITVVLARCEGR